MLSGLVPPCSGTPPWSNQLKKSIKNRGMAAALTALAGLGLAHAETPSPRLTAAMQAEVVSTLGAKLDANYVFPDTAQRVAKALKADLASGKYARQDDAAAFAEALGQDLARLGQDKHLRVRYDPDFRPEEEGEHVPSADEVSRARQQAEQVAYGVFKVERLAGNIGYIDLRGFEEAYFAGPAYSSALSLLQGTQALILDLRRNGGGEPESVAFLMSHFFAPGDARHLNDIYTRNRNETRGYWTSGLPQVRYTRPVYVLTSALTFSGGEECAYDFQTQKRATLIGDTTGGGANPGTVFTLGHGLVAFIPTGRAINPITRTNWEHVGVKPDIAVPAEQALQVAYVQALKKRVAEATSERERTQLSALLARVEKGEAEKVDYGRRP